MLMLYLEGEDAYARETRINNANSAQTDARGA